MESILLLDWRHFPFSYGRKEQRTSIRKLFPWKTWIVDLHKHNIDLHLIISISKKALLNQHKAKFTKAQSKRRTFHLPNLIPSNYIKYMKRLYLPTFSEI